MAKDTDVIDLGSGVTKRQVAHITKPLDKVIQRPQAKKGLAEEGKKERVIKEKVSSAKE